MFPESHRILKWICLVCFRIACELAHEPMRHLHWSFWLQWRHASVQFAPWLVKSRVFCRHYLSVIALLVEWHGHHYMCRCGHNHELINVIYFKDGFCIREFVIHFRFCPTWYILHWMLSVFTRCLWKNASCYLGGTRTHNLLLSCADVLTTRPPNLPVASGWFEYRAVGTANNISNDVFLASGRL